MFEKAVKSESKLRLALAGPSGSGKTYSALSIASNLTDKPIALVDTEHGSASKYADLFTFDVLNLDPPYHPDRYLDAIREAIDAGYGVIILDSLTHAWNGTGGLLDIVDEIAKKDRNSNTFAAWKKANPIQNKLIDGIIASDIHIIATMRSKQDYVQDKDENGKTVIKKMGMNPIQRDGFEYEMDVFIEMDIDNNAVVTKSRCTPINGKVINKPGKLLADTLKVWLSGAKAEKKAVITRDERNVVTPSNGNGHKPAVVDRPVMSLDMAESETSSDGTQYGIIDSETLSNKVYGINKMLAKPDLTPEKREEYQRKKDAIATILKYRAETEVQPA